MRVYLSGPMTGLPHLNFPAFNDAAARLREAGATVVNPAELDLGPTASWYDCMRVDIKALCDCDALCLLPGWEKSAGANLELHIAHRLGMDIWQIKDLEAALAQPSTNDKEHPHADR